MKLNKKMLNIPILLMIIISVLLLLNIPSRIHVLKEIAGTDKIGVISLKFNEEEKYENKKEMITTDKEMLYDIINTINNGKITTDIILDRLSPDYQLNFYKEDQYIKAFYWKNDHRYNLNIEGVQGEITVNQKLVNMIESILRQE